MKLYVRRSLVTLCWWCLAFISPNLAAATISWDGGGGDLRWQNAANWSGNVLPGASDDVIINAPGGIATTIVATLNINIRSLQCSNSLAQEGGALRLGNEASMIHGKVSITGNGVVSVTGDQASLEVSSGLASIAGSLTAVSGASITLMMTNYTHPAGCLVGNLLADGTGSRLVMPTLQTMSGSACSILSVRSLKGGLVSMPLLELFTEGFITLEAEGPGSRMDLPMLEGITATRRSVTLSARNEGVIDAPRNGGGLMLEVVVRSGGNLTTHQLTSLNGFTFDGISPDLALLETLGSGKVLAENGAQIVLPSLTEYRPIQTCFSERWSATGAGSKLSFPALSQMEGPTCGKLEIAARSGAEILLPQLRSVLNGSATFVSDGIGSRMDLPELASCPGPVGTVEFAALAGGSTQIPKLNGGLNIHIRLSADGSIPVAQLESLQALTVQGMRVELPSLAELGSGEVSASLGATIDLPSLARHSGTAGCKAYAWTASGVGSRITLSNLTSLAGPTCGNLDVRGIGGGRVDMTALTSIGNGRINFVADGSGSVIETPRLSDVSTATLPVSFDVKNLGAISMPLLAGGRSVRLSIQSGGKLDTVQIAQLKAVTLGSTNLTLPAIQQLNSAEVLVEQGGRLSLPNLITHLDAGDCGVAQFIARGNRSVLELPRLQTLSGRACGSLEIQALSGGEVQMNSLATLPQGRIDFLADGTNSLISLNQLTNSTATRYPVYFEARNAGIIRMPLMVGGSNVNVSVNSHATLTVDSLSNIASLSANRVSLNLPSLTQLHLGSLIITNGAKVSLPSLVFYEKPVLCESSTWLVRDPGSSLSLPALSHIIGGACLPLDMQASGGGLLQLPSLTNLAAQTVSILASGSNSLIELPALANFTDATRRSVIRTTNGGKVNIDARPLVVSGVAIQMEASWPGAPQIMLDASHTILHGRPWHSHEVKRREVGGPDTAFVHERNVPLTNAFQTLGPAAGVGVEFQATEFEAPVPLLELTALPAGGASMVLYALPAASVLVQAADQISAPAPWPLLYSVVMTNSFRILPNEPPAMPQRFFQTKAGP